MNVAILFVICFVVSFNASPKELNLHSISSLMHLDDSPILKIEETGEVYISPESIVISENGLFVLTESGENLLIPCLYSNQNGCYTIITHSDSSVYPVIRCNNCNLPFTPTIFNGGKCPRCGTIN